MDKIMYYSRLKYCEKCEKYWSHTILDDDICPACKGWSDDEWDDYFGDLDNTEEVKIGRKILL